MKTTFIGTIAACFLTATSLSAEQDCVFRRALTYSLPIDYSPHTINTAEQSHPQLDTNATLFRRGERGVLINELANSFEIDEDRKVLTVHLDTNCGWSDGHPVTAEQIVEGFKLTFTDRVNDYLPGRSMFKNGAEILSGEEDIEALGVRIIDDQTLEFDLVVPGELLLSALAYPVFTPAPLHLIAKDASAWPTKSLLRESSGAFKAISITNSEIKMVRNPHYCTDIPISPKEVIIKNAKETTDYLPMFFNGEVDIAHIAKYSPENLEAARKSGFEDFELKYRYEEVLGYLSLSQSRKWTDDKRIRRAMALTVDYAAIDRILNPERKSHNRPRQYSSQYEGYQVFPDSATLPSYKERLKQAKELMESAGYGPDNRLKLDFIFRGGYPATPLTHAFIAMFHQIYIDAKIDSVIDDDRSFFTELAANRYDIAMAEWGSDYPDPSNFLGGVLRNHLAPEKHFKDIRAALNDTYFILDHDKRFKEMAEIERKALDLNYAIPLYDLETARLLRSGYTLGTEFPLTGRNVMIDGCSGH